MKQLAMFDLDGTLLDSLKDIAASCNYALQDKDMPIHSSEEYLGFIGDGVYKLSERALPPEHRDQQTVLEIKQLFDTYYRENYDIYSKPFDGILEMLEKLIDQDVKLAVLSNKGDAFAKQIVEEYFPQVFDLVLGQREGIATKPDPVAVYEIMDQLGVRPEDAIYIGDSNVDIFTAKNAGIESIGVTWGYRSTEELVQAGADYLAKSPKKIAQIILKKD